jgi:hypothetical protein
MATSQYHTLYNKLLETGKTELIQPLNNELLNLPKQYQVIEHTDYKLKFSTAGQVYYARLKFNPKTLMESHKGFFEIYFIEGDSEKDKIVAVMEYEFNTDGLLFSSQHPYMDFSSFSTLFHNYIFNAWIDNNITVFP